MQLGAFSVSLAVKDLATSRAFYEALGFSVTGGAAAQNWLVLRNNGIVVGLFQGMFEGNLLTFNPGWDQHKQELASSRTCVRYRPSWTPRASRSQRVPIPMAKVRPICS